MKKGFSYLEILIVIVLFALGITALATARVQSTRMETTVREEKEAINDFEDFMEWIKSIDYDSIASGDSVFNETRIVWQVTDDSVIKGKDMIVEFSWLSRSGSMIYDTIITYIAER